MGKNSMEKQSGRKEKTRKSGGENETKYNIYRDVWGILAESEKVLFFSAFFCFASLSSSSSFDFVLCSSVQLRIYIQ